MAITLLAAVAPHGDAPCAVQLGPHLGLPGDRGDAFSVGDPHRPGSQQPQGQPHAEERCVDPRAAVSIATMSIFVIVIMASIARFAAASSWPFIASSKARGVICQEKPQRSLHQPHALSSPPLSTIAFQYRSVSDWSSVRTMKLTASFRTKFGSPLRPTNDRPSTVNSTVSSFPADPSG